MGEATPTRVRISPPPPVIHIMKTKTITICGSMTFIKEMEEVENLLKERGFIVFVPKGLELFRKKVYSFPKGHTEKVAAKIEHDFIRNHFRKIDKSDAVLVLNYTKGRKKNYIGGNTFLEMGYAFGRYKEIYLLNPIPRCSYDTEIKAMQPTIINEDLSKIN